MTEINWWKTSVGRGEIDRMVQAVEQGQLSDGAVTAEFEAAFAARLGVPHAVAVPSGSTALLLSMMAVGVGPGDEVIVPDSTWIATAHAAALLGATVVLADTRPDRPLLAVDEVRRKLTPRTKAIVPVHLAGRAADMEPLLELARSAGVRVVEDACQAVLSRGPAGFLGTLGDLGCYSLGVTKLLTTGQGGVIVTRDAELNERLRRLKFHGVATGGTPWERYTGIGLNLKFTDILASMGLQQVTDAESRVRHVTEIYRRYRDGLAGHPRMRMSEIRIEDGEVPLWTEVETPELVPIREYLLARGIHTKRVHPPLHQAPYFRAEGSYPHSCRFSDEILVLPSGPSQPLENVDATIEALRAYS